MSAQPRTAIQLRLPADLHAELTRRAAEQGVSLNLLMTTLLAGAVGFRLAEDPPAIADARSLAMEFAEIDGGHHKQYALVEIAKLLGGSPDVIAHLEPGQPA